MWSLIIPYVNLQDIAAFLSIVAVIGGTATVLYRRRKKPRVEIGLAERDGNLGLTLTARQIRHTRPTVTINGNPRRLRAVGNNGMAVVEFMERNVPYEIEPFPFQVRLSTMNTPMWVGVNILDENSNRLGGGEVRVANGKKGLFAVPQIVAPLVALSFDADELDAPQRHEYSFWPYVREGQRYRVALPPNVVSVTFVEKKSGYDRWQRIRKRTGLKLGGKWRLRVL